MPISPPPIKIVCKVCCWDKIVRPKHHDFVIPNCEHCGSEYMTYVGTKPLERAAALIRDVLNARLR